MTIDRHVTRGVGLKVSFEWDLCSSTLQQQQGAFTLSTDSVWHSTKIFDIFHIFAKEADLARSCSAVSAVYLHQKQYASFWGDFFLDVDYCMKRILDKMTDPNVAVFSSIVGYAAHFGAEHKYSAERLVARVSLAFIHQLLFTSHP